MAFFYLFSEHLLFGTSHMPPAFSQSIKFRCFLPFSRCLCLTFVADGCFWRRLAGLYESAPEFFVFFVLDRNDEAGKVVQGHWGQCQSWADDSQNSKGDHSAYLYR